MSDGELITGISFDPACALQWDRWHPGSHFTYPSSDWEDVYQPEISAAPLFQHYGSEFLPVGASA